MILHIWFTIVGLLFVTHCIVEYFRKRHNMSNIQKIDYWICSGIIGILIITTIMESWCIKGILT